MLFVNYIFYNCDYGYQVYKTGPDILLTCMNLVDPFFFITSYLTYVLLKPQLTNLGTTWIAIPKIIVYKYLRYVKYKKNITFRKINKK